MIMAEKFSEASQNGTYEVGSNSITAYESILSNLGTSKQAWLELLQQNGINYIWQETLDFLLQSEADLQEWNNYWGGNIDNLIADIGDYRQSRIAKSHADLSLAKFQQLYQENAKKALERLFVEPICDYVIKKFNDMGMDSAYIYDLRIQGMIERSHGYIGLMKRQ